MGEELQSACQYPVQCKVGTDYLNITTSFEIAGEVITGNAEMKFFFPDTVIDDEYVEELTQDFVSKTLEHLDQYRLTNPANPGAQKVYVTTIPLVNPISQQDVEDPIMQVSVHTEVYCPTCEKIVRDNIHSSIKIDLNKLHQHKEDIIIKVIGDSLVCGDCKHVLQKEKLIMKDATSNQIIADRDVGELLLLGTMSNQGEMQSFIISAMGHEDFFHEHEEAFWNAYSYVAARKWEVFLQELTKRELAKVLPEFVTAIPVDLSKERLLLLAKGLDLNEQEKRTFWVKANQLAIHHYLFITLFGWNMKQDSLLLGPNRAEFIFRYLPMPEELKSFHHVHDSYFSNERSDEIIKLQDRMEQQQQRIRTLQQENGRLTEKLGQAYSRISEQEASSFTLSNEVRNKSDILKIQQLKGLIEELKTELTKLTPIKQEEEQVQKVVLTEEQSEDEEVRSIYEIFMGKKILILGGYRSKQSREEKEYTIYTHDARNLDPQFYELLKNADIIITLTRYISHRAMWEAKEYAILEGKRIYFTAFTNIPTILTKVAKELLEEGDKGN